MQTIFDSRGPGHHGWYSNSLWARWSEDRILVGTRFFAPIHTGPESYPASCTMGTGSFPGVKQPGHSTDHPPKSSAEVKGSVDLYLYSHSGHFFMACSLPLPLLLIAKFILIKSFCSNGFHNSSLNLQLTLTYTTTKFRTTAMIILLVWGLKF